MEISEQKTKIRSLLNEAIKQDHIQEYELKFNLDFYVNVLIKVLSKADYHQQIDTLHALFIQFNKAEQKILQHTFKILSNPDNIS